MGANTALTPIHWIQIRRACRHYAQAVVGSDDRADKVMAELLVEPLRAMRQTSVVIKRLEGTLAKLIAELFPDPRDQRKAIQRLIDLGRESDGQDA